MGAESVFENLTAENTAAEIALILGADFEKKRTVVLVEGEDDVKVFRFLLGRDVSIVKAYGASATVDKFMPENFPDEKRVIGIRDRDYQRHKLFHRIFYCDRCCCEMMLISDDETFERVAVNFYRGPLSAAELRHELLLRLFYLSEARRLSAGSKLGLRFSGIDLGALAGPSTEAPSAEKVLVFLEKHNRDKHIPATLARRLCAASFTSDEAALDITNGHDFVELMCAFCNESGPSAGRRSLSERELSGALRCAYSEAAFSRTVLRADLWRYGCDNGLEIVK